KAKGTMRPYRRMSPLARRCIGRQKSLSDPIFCIDQDGDRSVIQKFHLHVRAKNACLHRFSQLSGKRVDKLFINGNRDIGFGSTEIRGAVSFLSAGMEGKLTNDDNVTCRVPHAEVHDTISVVENAKVDNLRS